MKKKLIVLIAVLCVIIIVSAIIVSGVLNPNVYLRITNRTDGEVYNYWMYYSYQGKTGTDAEMAQGLSKPTGAPGDNSRLPFVVGESVKVQMRPNKAHNVPVGEKLTIDLYMHAVSLRRRTRSESNQKTHFEKTACDDSVRPGSDNLRDRVDKDGFDL